MKRIGKTDGGGVLVEMTEADIISLMAGFQSFGQLYDVIEISIPNVQPAPVTGPLSITLAPDNSTQKSCEQCGKLFTPPRKDSRMCSKACLDKSYRFAKAKAVTPAKVEVIAKPTANPDPTVKRFCLTCKKSFEPHRKDQTCCSKACRAKLPSTTYPKYDAAAAKAKRLAALKNWTPRSAARSRHGLSRRTSKTSQSLPRRSGKQAGNDGERT